MNKNEIIGVKKILRFCADIWADPKSILLNYKLGKCKGNEAVLIGTPAHHNLGDHLIAKNEIVFLKKYCGYSDVIEIPTRVFLQRVDQIEKKLDVSTPIFITGGGWMGDLWPEDEEIIELIVERFKKHTIVIFPQTIYYNAPDVHNDSIIRTKDIFSKTKSIILITRDKLSFETSEVFFSSNNVKCYLGPDMGLMNPCVREEKKKPVIYFCFREDREKARSLEADSIREFIKDKGYIVQNISTMSKFRTTIWQRGYKIKSLIRKMAKASLVITDRLHGMIFAVISGTKCIAIDNKTHKVEGVYKSWLSNNERVKVTINDESIFELIDEELVSEDNICGWYDEINNQFLKMAEFIKKNI